MIPRIKTTSKGRRLPGGGEGKVDGAEEQVRDAQADDEGGGGVNP